MRKNEKAVAVRSKSPHLHVKQDVRCLFDLALVWLFASIHRKYLADDTQGFTI